MTSKTREIAVNILLILTSLAISLIIINHLLLLVGKSDRHGFLDYPDTWDYPSELREGGYLKPNLDILVTDGYGGTVRWQTNSFGFRNDYDVSFEPPPGTQRFLSMGDSFTAGYRVAQEHTFSYLLETWLVQTIGPTQVLVSCTEEPVVGLLYLQKFGWRFHPHTILLGITLGNDIAQVYRALHPQGPFTLNPEDYTSPVRPTANPHPIGFGNLVHLSIPTDYLLPPHSPAYFYASLRHWLRKQQVVQLLFRPAQAIIGAFDKQGLLPIFDFINGLGMYLDPPPTAVITAYQQLYQVLAAFQNLCQAHGISLVVLLFPQRFQVQPPDWEATADKYRLKKERFDLMAPNRHLTGFCRKLGIICLDPTPYMRERYKQTGKNMYLPAGDMHWNRQGHLAVFEFLQQSLPLAK